MNVLLFGATGMVGQGVLRECLLDPEVRSVVAIGRSKTGQRHEKLREIVHENLFDLSAIGAPGATQSRHDIRLRVGGRYGQHRARTHHVGAGEGKTENALLRLPFKAAYMFRPAVIQPLHGIKSKTKSYRILYAVMGPILPVLKALFPGYVTTTEQVGRAMLKVARQGASKQILENRDINAL